ncbi:hypothetical protein ACO0LL_05695 [Undibacterium sp. TC4M20W]|uniref:hypothetical protein n=1 Tax=Undibacterium sp. TC4M20W TaxID=3413052 RepID=UPI003BF0A6A1
MSQKQDALLIVAALFAKISDNYGRISYDDADFRAAKQQVDAAVDAPDAAVQLPPVEVEKPVYVIDPVVNEKLDAIEEHLGVILHLLPEPAQA